MDSSVLRFLRARKWDIDRAMAMCVTPYSPASHAHTLTSFYRSLLRLCAALCFRFDMDVEGIIQKGEDGMKDVPGFLNQFRRGISYIRGNTDNIPGEYPIYFIREFHHTLLSFALVQYV
jgi:hypothetical protein